MSKITIQQVFGIDSTTLVVFVALEHCWQLGLISAGGAVFGEGKIYFTLLKLRSRRGWSA